jgi:ABC-2 type transport system ATP-binding protein
VILSSHILHEIDAVCDRSMIINRGRIVASGTLAQMRKRYELGVRYQLRLRGDLNKIDPILESIHPELRRVRTAPVDESGFHQVTLDTSCTDDFGSALIRGIGCCGELELRECFRHESNLEDVFLAATRRSWDETVGKPSDERYSRIPLVGVAGPSSE